MSLNAVATPAALGENDAGTFGYTGPCPPEGDVIHHYQITVIALSVPTLGIDATTHPAVVGFLTGHNALAAGAACRDRAAVGSRVATRSGTAADARQRHSGQLPRTV
jgi:hypothetical protein